MSVTSDSSPRQIHDEGRPIPRCRDKVRQWPCSSSPTTNSPPPLPAVTMDLGNPFKLISLAIQHDEKMNDEDILNVPLESGSLYNHRLFTAGLVYLQMKMTENAANTWWKSSSSYKRKVSRLSSQELLKSTKQTPPQAKKTALTPIILSGLLSDCSHYSSSTCNINNNNNNNHNHNQTMPTSLNSSTTTTTTTTSTDLVCYTQQMRRAALARVKLRKERHRVQRIVTPILAVLSLFCLYLYTMKNLQSVFQEYGFGDSCETSLLWLLPPGVEKIGSTTKPFMMEEWYHTVCREAEAYTWEKLNQAQSFRYLLEDCTVSSCPLAETLLEEHIPLYTMHTQLQETIIPLEDILGRQRRPKRKQRTTMSHRNRKTDQEYVWGMSVKWVGDSLINRLVREAILATHEPAAHSNIESFSLLDAGSGLSGLLFALLDLPFRGGWNYLGITISQPEVKLTNQLLDLHQIVSESKNGGDSLRNVTIQRANFDDPLPPKSFHTIVAVESLGYSQNINRTIDNLVAALKPKGSLIIVEDVVSPWAKDSVDLQQLVNLTSKRSLLTHQDWVKSIASAGLMFHGAARDLSLEYDWMYPLNSEKPILEFARPLAQRFSQWYDRGRSDGSSKYGTGVRAIRLFSDLIQHSRGNYLRQLSHRRADLTLMMYTCTKI